MEQYLNNQQDISILENAIRNGVTDDTVKLAEKIGKHLASGNPAEKLKTSQLRKFFGEVKRQQMTGYKESSFVLLKPKLAYAVGRVKDNQNHYKIEDLYEVLSKAIDVVVSKDTIDKPMAFKNFIAIFEAIVAYHKKYIVKDN